MVIAAFILLFLIAYIAIAAIVLVTIKTGNDAYTSESVIRTEALFGLLPGQLDFLILPVFPLILSIFIKKFAPKEKNVEISLWIVSFLLFMINVIYFIAAGSPPFYTMGLSLLDYVLGFMAWLFGGCALYILVYLWILVFTRPEKARLIETTTSSAAFAIFITIVVFLLEKISGAVPFLTVFWYSGHGLILTYIYVMVREFVLAFGIIYYYKNNKLGAMSIVFATMYLTNALLSGGFLISTVSELLPILILRVLELLSLFVFISLANQKK